MMIYLLDSCVRLFDIACVRISPFGEVRSIGMVPYWSCISRIHLVSGSIVIRVPAPHPYGRSSTRLVLRTVQSVRLYTK